MFETVSYFTLQQYWWIIISLLASLLVFLMFVQGGQTMIYSLGKNNIQRQIIVNSLGRKWEFTFTTLVTFGGAFFAAFPLFYATSFGGAYWLWMTILFCFVIQAIAYEYRSKPNNFLGQKTYDVFLFLNGALGTILIGTAVGTFFSGSEFIIDRINIINPESPIVSQWINPLRGFEALLNPGNISLGLSIFFLTRILALLYFMNNIDDTDIFPRIQKQLWYNVIMFLPLFLFFLYYILTNHGYSYTPVKHIIYVEKFKYWHNLQEMPIVAVIFIIGVLSVLTGIFLAIKKKNTKSILLSGPGTILTVFSLFCVAGFNNTAYYPSTYDLQSSLTIINSSSSRYTLITMSYVSILVPFVFTYIFFTWRAINKKRINKDELKESSHVY